MHSWVSVLCSTLSLSDWLSAKMAKRCRALSIASAVAFRSLSRYNHNKLAKETCTSADSALHRLDRLCCAIEHKWTVHDPGMCCCVDCFLCWQTHFCLHVWSTLIALFDDYGWQQLTDHFSTFLSLNLLLLSLLKLYHVVCYVRFYYLYSSFGDTLLNNSKLTSNTKPRT